MSLNVDPSQWKLCTAGGIRYKLFEGYPKGSFDEDKGSVDECIIIEASNLRDFITESFSQSVIVPGGKWDIVPARSYPGWQQLVTKSLSFEPFIPGLPCDPFGICPPEESSGDTYSQFLKLSIKYESGKSKGNEDPNSDDQSEDILEITCNLAGEYLCIPPAGMKWENGQPVNVPTIPLTKILPMMEWSAKFPRVPREMLAGAIASARAYMGLVNSAPMVLGGGMAGAAPETLLFTGMNVQNKYSWRETKPFAQMEFKFLDKSIVEDGEIKGHNHFYSPKQGKFVKVKRQPADEPVYGSADLNDLLSTA